MTKPSNVARRLNVQTNGRLIVPELFSISTGGEAVKKSYQCGRSIFFPRPLQAYKWTSSLELQVDPFMYISSPSSSAVLTEGHAN